MTPRPFLREPVLPHGPRHFAAPIATIGDICHRVRMCNVAVARSVVRILVENHPFPGTDYLQLGAMPGLPTDIAALRLNALLAHAGDATAVATGGAA